MVTAWTVPDINAFSRLAITPAGICVGSPESNTAIGPIGSIKGIARIPIRADDTAPNSAGRIGATAWTVTNMADFFAVADDRSLIGNGTRHQRSRKDKCENGRDS